MDYEVLTFIGRFQPFHVGHQTVVDSALERAQTVALVLGSHGQPRNARNPFTTSERIEMITAVYPNEVADGRIVFVPQEDHTYNLDRWIAGVQTGVATAASRGGWSDKPPRIGLIGHSKDHSSFYLKSFPTWGSVEVGNVRGIDATEIRNQYFYKRPAEDFWECFVVEALPDPVVGWLYEFATTPEFDQVAEEMRFLAGYSKQWEAAPYPPTFVTVDAVVVQSGHILLVKRGALPGKGLWALPGGFLDQGETLRRGAIRELCEETRIDVPIPVLNGSIVAEKTFDDPHRSLRGRTVTTAFYIRLADRVDLPKVKGSDDAAKARWVPLADVNRSVMFEDHYDIIETMVAI